MERYAAKLLFQFRVATDGVANKRRICEERILVIDATSAKEALAQAKRAGRNAQHTYTNDHGGRVYFEFVGILDLMHLGPECDSDEVWYEIRDRVEPMERRLKIVPRASDLSAIRWESDPGSHRRRSGSHGRPKS